MKIYLLVSFVQQLCTIFEARPAVSKAQWGKFSRVNSKGDYKFLFKPVCFLQECSFVFSCFTEAKSTDLLGFVLKFLCLYYLYALFHSDSRKKGLNIT